MLSAPRSGTRVFVSCLSTASSNATSGQKTAQTGTQDQQASALGPDGLPVAVDWVERGAVTHVSNQGSCGSCWAFATTVTIEGINFIVTGTRMKLSEQQFVDCSYGVTIDDYRSYRNIAESDLKRFVAVQPVCVAVGADRHFMAYTDGVLDGKNYTIRELGELQPLTKNRLGHWIAVVAYGEFPDGQKFWKLKNSYGDEWGLEGG